MGIMLIANGKRCSIDDERKILFTGFTFTLFRSSLASLCVYGPLVPNTRPVFFRNFLTDNVLLVQQDIASATISIFPKNGIRGCMSFCDAWPVEVQRDDARIQK